MLSRYFPEKILTFLIYSLSVLVGTVSYAQQIAAEVSGISEVLLEVKPQRCVALHQGQVCYQSLRFNWRSESAGDYCLYEGVATEALKCWKKARSGFFSIEFHSAENMTFVLRERGQTPDLALTMIEVAWVYKSSRKSKMNWRLF